ncbi:unnamed protein product [Fusarium graminearum]|uniref:Chromosome 2, complete genome n=1 Tax=Gibberella zeae (strain ATCC MYA-4620 / CBS 123657 / FGSC 9075 / NRRL 31084 / PH-1) TaxID=229533 RepID=I1S6E0_GIBZE|nr:hypothetical protein FGSG_12411 [Fusarium graminearum PH-1]ESU09606.1 hypothetical protein FGSG_12411 [Fusarium graminearum PH-1]EYB21992.1 hypothetical protein FG05_12411 [Fusarium graminearum]CEF78431.1 unnamed protein product [Fusarium graminearum]CZS81724.1 unnamed protein product [Fusarium graminearum]|eukprot:XP_011322105.1 hypothetical protein FGSG_12411 [Fusarium graminearum PH-1]
MDSTSLSEIGAMLRATLTTVEDRSEHRHVVKGHLAKALKSEGDKGPYLHRHNFNAFAPVESHQDEGLCIGNSKPDAAILQACYGMNLPESVLKPRARYRYRGSGLNYCYY